MGTQYQVTVVGELDAAATEAAADAIEAALENVDGKMSTYKPDSELSQLNQHPGGEPFSVSAETFEVFRLAGDIAARSGGALDITVGPLVNAWGFGPDGPADAPAEAVIEELLALTGPGQIALDPEAKTVTKADGAVYCDLSAIAKGYAVDKVYEALAALGYENYMVEVGGEVRAAGRNMRGVPWRIAIEKPLEGELAIQEIVGLSGVALATSGNYRNFYRAGDKRISHTINPRTGRPVEHSLASASVIHTECATADAWATAMMVLGPEEGMAVAAEHDLAVSFIIHDDGEGDSDAFTVRHSPSFAPYIAGR